MPKPATILAESSINDSVISALVVALRTDLPECRADFASFVGIDTMARREVGGKMSVDDGLPQDDVPAIGQQFVGDHSAERPRLFCSLCIGSTLAVLLALSGFHRGMMASKWGALRSMSLMAAKWGALVFRLPSCL
jgi:hypothetical protein